MDVIKNNIPSEHLTAHKIKAEWTKSAKNENFDESSSSSDKDKLEIDEGETTTNDKTENGKKIEILEQIIFPSQTQKPRKCHFCDRNLKTMQLLLEHHKTHENTFFHCLECDRKFKRKSSLRRHSYLHQGKFKYECKDCKMTFIDKTKYGAHQNTKHLKAAPFLCLECLKNGITKPFASQDYLKRHQITHKDEYRYHCSKCDQKFKWLTSLQMHQTIHSQNKSVLECPDCAKRFFNQRNFDRHQKIHQEVKYKCMLCDKAISNRKDNIRRHIRHLHANVPKQEISKNIDILSNEVKKLKDFEDGEYTDDTIEKESVALLEVISDKQSAIASKLECSDIPKAPNIINNRVNVIQSIGNPNRHKMTLDSACNTNKTSDALTYKPNETEAQLPPRKEHIPQPPITASSTVKPKYDPIEHYRKILGITKDDDDDTARIEDNTHEEEITTPFIHWRKRTSQNFLFRR